MPHIAYMFCTHAWHYIIIPTPLGTAATTRKLNNRYSCSPLAHIIPNGITPCGIILSLSSCPLFGLSFAFHFSECTKCRFTTVSRGPPLLLRSVHVLPKQQRPLRSCLHGALTALSAERPLRLQANHKRPVVAQRQRIVADTDACHAQAPDEDVVYRRRKARLPAAVRGEAT